MSKLRQAGFSLIELMIAMILGLLVLGAAIAIFQSNQRTFGANQGQNRIQENARAAYEMMAMDLRSVGSSACSNEAMVMGTDTQSVAFRDPMNGSTANKLVMVAASQQSYRVKVATKSQVTLTDDSPVASDVFDVNDPVMVCNAAMTGFSTVASVAGQTVTLATPLDFDPADTDRASNGSISIARMGGSTWEVKSNGRSSGKSLYVTDAQGNVNEAAEGVQSLALTYHTLNAGGYSGTPATTDWPYVNAARVTMPMKIPMTTHNGGESTDVSRTISTTVSIRSRNL